MAIAFADHFSSSIFIRASENSRRSASPSALPCQQKQIPNRMDKTRNNFDRTAALRLLGPAPQLPPLDTETVLALCASKSRSPTRIRRDRIPAMQSLMNWLEGEDATTSSHGQKQDPIAFIHGDDDDASNRRTHGLSTPARNFSPDFRSFDREAALKLLEPSEFDETFHRARALKLLLPTDAGNSCESVNEPVATTAPVPAAKTMFDREGAIALLAPRRSSDGVDHQRPCKRSPRSCATAEPSKRVDDEKTNESMSVDRVPQFDRERAVALLAPSRKCAEEHRERSLAMSLLL